MQHILSGVQKIIYDIQEDDDLILAVYDYWLNKRLESQHCLIPTGQLPMQISPNQLIELCVSFECNCKV